jgi:hypothetical protein
VFAVRAEKLQRCKNPVDIEPNLKPRVNAAGQMRHLHLGICIERVIMQFLIVSLLKLRSLAIPVWWESSFGDIYTSNYLCKNS